MPDVRASIEAVYRIESPRIIATVARITRDVGVAEELAQDALVTALETWPTAGVPDNPGAWLMQTAKNRAIDAIRRRGRLDDKREQIARELEPPRDPSLDLASKLDDDVGDDLLRLVFTCCHPVLSSEARVALTLRLLGGLTTDEIARAFLVPEPTIAQRIVRAKRTLADKQVPFEVPRADELVDRIASVLEVIYLVFNEGYVATTGDAWIRPELCEDALRLGRVLAGLLPDDPEVWGLVALMEIQGSRLHARVASDGTPILLLDQNRLRWDQGMIRRGLAAVERATGRAGEHHGSYLLQAEIAACHARAKLAADTDWVKIAALYAALVQLTQSPLVELSRAMAVAMAFGPQAGLDVADTLVDVPALANYYALPSVRGDLLAKLGRNDEARRELERAAALTRNEREKTALLARASELNQEPSSDLDP